MTPRTRFGSAAALAAVAATLALPGSAGAVAGSKSFNQTYPVASRLCANVARGAGPKRLHRSATQVLAGCSLLQGAFNAQRASVLAAEASIAHAVAADRAAADASCAGHTHRPPCARARVKERKELGALGRQRVHAARSYYAAVEGARVAFWTAIHALPGGAGLHPDAAIPEQSS